MYFHMKYWMKSEMSSTVIEDAPICSCKSTETAGEDAVSTI